MKSRILKVKDWLKFREPDYQNFMNHVQVWEDDGIPHGLKDLLELAINYNLPTPRMVNGELIFDLKITPHQTVEHININISKSSDVNLIVE